MKHATFLVLLALGSLGGLAMAQTANFPPRSSANTVFVGHSLINENMPRMVKVMAESRPGMRLTSTVQIINGAPLSWSWERCRRANWTGQWPPRKFACDEIDAGSANGPYDSLIATDANNSIESNRVYNRTHEQLERFMELLLSRNPQARTFMYTSWESWDFHKGRWLEAIDSELAQYETIARQAEQISASRGRNGRVEVLPVNLALRNLVQAMERGEVSGVTNREQIFDDGVHMTPLGNYFVASVVFAAIYNQSADGVTTTIPGEWGGTLVQVPPATAKVLHRIAWQTISIYRGGSTPGATPPRPPQSLQVQ